MYYETREPTEAQRLLKEGIITRIDYWYTEFPAMVSRKVAAKLWDEGYWVGRKLVRSYMREMEIYAIYPKAKLSKNDGKEGDYHISCGTRPLCCQIIIGRST